MEILWLLIPLSAGLVLVILGVFGWAVHHGQFDDIEREGQRILDSDAPGLDTDQTPALTTTQQSPARRAAQPRNELEE